jgi:4-hydroxybenzoate polyprenyltransferase
MYMKTALKLMAFCLLAVVVMLFAGGGVVVLTGSGELGLLAMMGGFLLCMYIFAELYPRLFKDFKVYWDDKEAKRLKESELENEECQEIEHESKMPLM